MKPLPAASAITYRCLVLVAALAPTGAYAETPRSPFGIEWFLDCPQPTLERLDPEVIERTQCGIVTAPLDHGAPERGRISFDITRVGAKLPLSRQGAIFANPGAPGSTPAAPSPYTWPPSGSTTPDNPTGATLTASWPIPMM